MYDYESLRYEATRCWCTWRGGGQAFLLLAYGGWAQVGGIWCLRVSAFQRTYEGRGHFVLYRNKYDYT